jgi:feruloyl-CoA synthase
LLDGGHSAARPVAILSDNSINQAFVMFGAMTVGVPVMPVSPAYSLMSQDHEKLKVVIGHNDPSVIFVDNPAPFAGALGAIDMAQRTLVVGTMDGAPDGAVALSAWLAVTPGPAVDDAAAAITLDTIGKFF